MSEKEDFSIVENTDVNNVINELEVLSDVHDSSISKEVQESIERLKEDVR